MVLVTKPRVPDWLYDAPELERPHCGAGEEWGEQEVVPGTDDDDVVEVSQTPAPFKVPEDTVTAPARPQNDQVLSGVGSGAGGGRETIYTAAAAAADVAVAAAE